MNIEDMYDTFEMFDDEATISMGDFKHLLQCMIEDEGDCTRAITCIEIKPDEFM